MIRWLFSTVSTSMAWDDHDMSDDWNISRSWREEMDRKDWWHERAIGGIMSYWIYQYIGNLSPRGARRERALRAGAGQPRRDRCPARVGARDRHHRIRARAGASTATSAACGRCSSTRAPAGS